MNGDLISRYALYKACIIYADGYIQIANWSHDKYGHAWWFFVDGEYATGVTHFMPLPKPPKEDV